MIEKSIHLIIPGWREENKDRHNLRICATRMPNSLWPQHGSAGMQTGSTAMAAGGGTGLLNSKGARAPSVQWVGALFGSEKLFIRSLNNTDPQLTFSCLISSRCCLPLNLFNGPSVNVPCLLGLF